MTRIRISDPSQLLPAQDLYRKMRQAETKTGASAGGVGPSTYVDDNGEQIQAATVTGADGAVAFVPPGADAPEDSAVVVNVVTSQDLGEFNSMVEDMQAGGDIAASARAVVGDVEFVKGGSQ